MVPVYEQNIKRLITALESIEIPEIHLIKTHQMYGALYFLYRCDQNKKLYTAMIQNSNITCFEITEENAPWAFLEDDAS